MEVWTAQGAWTIDKSRGFRSFGQPVEAVIASTIVVEWDKLQAADLRVELGDLKLA